MTLSPILTNRAISSQSLPWELSPASTSPYILLEGALALLCQPSSWPWISLRLREENVSVKLCSASLFSTQCLPEITCLLLEASAGHSQVRAILQCLETFEFVLRAGYLQCTKHPEWVTQHKVPQAGSAAPLDLFRIIDFYLFLRQGFTI